VVIVPGYRSRGPGSIPSATRFYDRLCGLVIRVPGYRSRGPGWIPGATRFSDRLCGVVVILPGYRSRGPGWFPGATRFSDRLCGVVVIVPGYRSIGTAFDSRRYRIFREVVSLERGPLSLVSTLEERLVLPLAVHHIRHTKERSLDKNKVPVKGLESKCHHDWEKMRSEYAHWQVHSERLVTEMQEILCARHICSFSHGRAIPQAESLKKDDVAETVVA
jgi:hypothetical protein